MQLVPVKAPTDVQPGQSIQVTVPPRPEKGIPGSTGGEELKRMIESGDFASYSSAFTRCEKAGPAKQPGLQVIETFSFDDETAYAIERVTPPEACTSCFRPPEALFLSQLSVLTHYHLNS